MKIALISDNHDTLVGMRLAGIEGVVVHETDELMAAIKDAVNDRDVGVIFITELLVNKAKSYISDLKLNSSGPLILEIPDRHGFGRPGDSITDYIRDAIGISI